MKKILIVDALNLFIRNYVTNPSISKNGDNIGGISGTLKSLQKICRETKPSLILVAWDGPEGSRKRKVKHANYKNGRKPLRLNRNIKVLNEQQELENKLWQQFRLFEYLNVCPIVQFMEEQIEADDIISYLCQHKDFSNDVKIILSNDKDFIQLCDDKTILIRPTQEQILNKKTVVKEYGIHPLNFALARSICGDPSDNLDGVGGVGLQTLSTRMTFLAEEKEYSIDEVVKYCQEIDSKLKVYKTISENKELIVHNYDLMQLKSPSISLQTRGKIDYILENYELQFNKTEFLKMSITDGFADVSFSDLFATFNRMINESKST